MATFRRRNDRWQVQLMSSRMLLQSACFCPIRTVMSAANLFAVSTMSWDGRACRPSLLGSGTLSLASFSDISFMGSRFRQTLQETRQPLAIMPDEAVRCGEA